MATVLIFLVALLPVLFIGAALVEMLLWAAPRRGKRPDAQTVTRSTPLLVCVRTRDGDEFHGTAQAVFRALNAGGYLDAPRDPTARHAERLLAEWEREGRITIRGEWG